MFEVRTLVYGRTELNNSEASWVATFACEPSNSNTIKEKLSRLALYIEPVMPYSIELENRNIIDALSELGLVNLVYEHKSYDCIGFDNFVEHKEVKKYINYI